MIGIVAWREFRERLRSKLFIGVNVFLALAIVGAVVLASFLGGDEPETRLGVADTASAEVAAVAVELAPAHGLALEAVELPGASAAEAALADGTVDVVLVDGAVLVAEAQVSLAVEALLNAAAQAVDLAAALEDAGVPAERRDALLTREPLAVRLLAEDADQPFGAAAVVVLFAVAVLYGLLAFNGQWVAQGITEEKQSRVVEVLLSSVPPHVLLGGKILGLGALGLAQVSLLAGVGLGALLAVGGADVPVEARTSVLLVVAWYVLGYGVYATLFAVSGAVAARSEDLQGTTAPVILVLVAALFAAQAAVAAPRSTFAVVSSYVPFTAPMVQPVRFAAGASSVAEMGVAALVTVATIAVLVPLAGRFYRGGALQTRARVGLSAAWRAAGR